jgi:hypothetical protein
VAGRLTGPVGFLTHPAYLLPILYLALGPGIVSTELFYRSNSISFSLKGRHVQGWPLCRTGMCGFRFCLHSGLPSQS